MRAFLVFLVLCFGTLQTVSLVQCCCGPLCSTPGDICRDHDHEAGKAPCTSCDGHADGASGKTSTDEDGNAKRCTHLSPTTELQPVPADAAAPSPPVGELAVDPPSLIPAAPALLPRRETVPRARPPRPLYLRDSALLL